MTISFTREPVTPSKTASDLHASAGNAFTSCAHLFVAMSCESPLDPPTRHTLEGTSEVVIGRGPRRTAVRSNDAGRSRLTLTLADRHVSSEHARVVRHENGWMFEDLDSKNGSFVNGRPARGSLLADGDYWQVGHTVGLFRAALPTPACAPLDLEATARVPVLSTLIPRLARELDILAKAAMSRVPILLLSETGTGKELLARAVHALSARSGAFVPVNCGGLPVSLVESVLFGHQRGAFTGAVSDHDGLFRAANSGTILLDEVGDIPLAAQAAILRTLQEGELLPVGATRPVRVDVRIVSATHRNLEAGVAEGTFREDLLARLSGFTFCMPPLRERREDIGLLVSVILRSIMAARGGSPSLTPEAGLLLLRHDWPRNVRELEHCLARAVSLADEGRLEREHLPPEVRNGAVPAPRSTTDDRREQLLRLLKEGGGNVALVAQRMSTSRSQVHRWMKRFGIDPGTFRG
jgi:hypothetical protein